MPLKLGKGYIIISVKNMAAHFGYPCSNLNECLLVKRSVLSKLYISGFYMLLTSVRLFHLGHVIVGRCLAGKNSIYTSYMTIIQGCLNVLTIWHDCPDIQSCVLYILINFYAMYGTVCYQLTHWHFNDCENMCTTSYFHHDETLENAMSYYVLWMWWHVDRFIIKEIHSQRSLT